MNRDVRCIRTPFCNEQNITSTECAKRQGGVAEVEENTHDVFLMNIFMLWAASKTPGCTANMSVELFEYWDASSADQIHLSERDMVIDCYRFRKRRLNEKVYWNDVRKRATP